MARREEPHVLRRQRVVAVADRRRRHPAVPQRESVVVERRAVVVDEPLLQPGEHQRGEEEVEHRTRQKVEADVLDVKPPRRRRQRGVLPLVVGQPAQRVEAQAAAADLPLEERDHPVVRLAREVEDDGDADEDVHGGEEARARRRRVEVAVAHRRHRHRHKVEGVDRGPQLVVARGGVAVRAGTEVDDVGAAVALDVCVESDTDGEVYHDGQRAHQQHLQQLLHFRPAQLRESRRLAVHNDRVFFLEVARRLLAQDPGRRPLRRLRTLRLLGERTQRDRERHRRRRVLARLEGLLELPSSVFAWQKDRVDHRRRRGGLPLVDERAVLVARAVGERGAREELRRVDPPERLHARFGERSHAERLHAALRAERVERFGRRRVWPGERQGVRRLRKGQRVHLEDVVVVVQVDEAADEQHKAPRVPRHVQLLQRALKFGQRVDEGEARRLQRDAGLRFRLRRQRHPRDRRQRAHVRRRGVGRRQVLVHRRRPDDRVAPGGEERRQLGLARRRRRAGRLVGERRLDADVDVGHDGERDAVRGIG